MRPKAKPPTEPKARKLWDSNRHWERTWAKRIIEHEIIPEHIQHFRPDLLRTFRTKGLSATERLLAEYKNFFLDCAKNRNMTAQEAKGAIENLEGLVRALKAQKRKKQYAKLNELKASRQANK